MLQIRIKLPDYYEKRLNAYCTEKGLTHYHVILEALDKYLGKVVVEEEFWESGWPKSVKCNRCERNHDPLEHPLNVGLLNDAILAGRKLKEAGG